MKVEVTGLCWSQKRLGILLDLRKALVSHWPTQAQTLLSCVPPHPTIHTLIVVCPDSALLVGYTALLPP